MSKVSIAMLALVAGIIGLAAAQTSSPYRKVEEFSGASFFDGFDTYTGLDPTDGFVNYVDFETAIPQNLTAFIFYEDVEAANAYVGVDFEQLNLVNTSTGRDSVRLTSKSTFGVGLLAVVDVLHAPTGPGVWPAVWLLGNVTGQTWPNDGELDIMEWVNDATYNSMTLHTAPGCTVTNSSAFQGTLLNDDCNCGGSGGPATLGCSVTAPSTIQSNGAQLATAGAAFNAQGGGVYVLEWATSGVNVWLFPRNQLPTDLANETPDPSTWTAQPLASFAGSGCAFDRAFQQQQLIINIDLCGAWAGSPSVWAEVAGTTGVDSCSEYVASHPESFQDAYFEFASIKMFSSNPAAPGIAGQSKVKRVDGTAKDANRGAADLRHRGRYAHQARHVR